MATKSKRNGKPAVRSSDLVRQIRAIAKEVEKMAARAHKSPSLEYLEVGIVDWSNAVDHLWMAANLLPNDQAHRSAPTADVERKETNE